VDLLAAFPFLNPTNGNQKGKMALDDQIQNAASKRGI